MKRLILSALTACLCAYAAFAQEGPQKMPASKAFPVSFTWGIDIGSSIDMSCQDMSTLNADAYFGLRTPLLNILGVGAGLHAMVNNNSVVYPVYLIARTSFFTTPQLCYVEIRGGIAFNNYYDASSRGALYLSPSVGINLARNDTFTSYLSLGFCYNGGRLKAHEGYHDAVEPQNMAILRLGIAF